MAYKSQILVTDHPFAFGDKLKMSSTKRGAEAQYQGTMKDKDILAMPIEDIVADDALLALWVPSSKLQLGLDCMKKYGFDQKQTWIWVKTKNIPLINLAKSIKKIFISKENTIIKFSQIFEKINDFDLNSTMKFYMGRTFRQTHEIVLVGTRGKINKLLENKSQLSVFLGNNPKHSSKPEALQDRLDIMYPKAINRVEFFARRQRSNYICLGNEAPMTEKEDIKNSLEKLKRISDKDLKKINKYIAISDDKSNKKLAEIWKNI